MSLFAMQNFHALTLFIWLVSVLTLSISDETKTDGSSSLMTTLDTSFIDGDSKTEHRTLSSPIQFTPKSNSTKTVNKNVATPLVAGEGGPISITSTTQQTTTASHLINIASNSDLQANLSKEEENVPYVKRRKNTSKIVSRKGANEMLDTNKSIPIFETIPSNDTKPVIESSTTASAIHNNEKVDINKNILKSNITEKHINNALNTTVNNTSPPTSVMQQKLSTSAPVTASSVQEHKPKPTATVVGPNSDKQAFIPHTKGSRLGMPKKIDYVLPVIVILMALPVLGAIIFMVYKQGRDCWDKRHYRRMDFLIDGMYND